jgi:argininosuccinate lyase
MSNEHSNDKYKLWGGRFETGNDDLMKMFNASLPIDKRLWKEDIIGSKGWAKAIQKVGLIDKDELNLLLKGLDQVYEEWNDNKFVEKDNDEDIHTANERRLRELIGDVAMKLHTGRSRNDQVAVDMRLWLNENLKVIENNLSLLIKSLLKRAEAEIDVLMPGYTHLQRAQPIRWSHLLCSYIAALDRDYDRLKQLQQRINLSPLGSGAIAGNPFNIDRESLAKDLNFLHATYNSIDSTANRDFIYEFLFVSSSIATSLSKFAEDFIIYNTKEFSFIQLSDSYCTGSSLMPQKKNADSLELIRGKTGRLFGRLSGFLMTVKAIPTSYNKDLQEDKEALFDSYDTINYLIRIATGVIDTLKINRENMQAALSVDLLATDLAYYLVRKGVPFRAAHTHSGQCVSLAEKQGCSLKDLKLEQLKEICEHFDTDVLDIYNFEKSVEQYTSTGGTARSSVQTQINHFKSKHV